MDTWFFASRDNNQKQKTYGFLVGNWVYSSAPLNLICFYYFNLFLFQIGVKYKFIVCISSAIKKLVDEINMWINLWMELKQVKGIITKRKNVQSNWDIQKENSA